MSVTRIRCERCGFTLTYCRCPLEHSVVRVEIRPGQQMHKSDDGVIGRAVPYIGGPWDGEFSAMREPDVKVGLRDRAVGGFYELEHGSVYYRWRWHSDA
jgi:hypothetical protein